MSEKQDIVKKESTKPTLAGSLLRAVGLLLVLLLISAAIVGVYAYRWIDMPLSQNHSPVEVEVLPGSSSRDVAQLIVNAGVQTQAQWLYYYFRYSGKARNIKAGIYEFTPKDTPRSMLRKLVNGEVAMQTLVIPEGWTFSQIRARLDASTVLKHDTQGMSDAQIMEALGRPGVYPEGLFYPDTYSFSRGSSDLKLLKQALTQMDKVLDKAWQDRQPELPLKTPYEALILASIIEKETGHAGDRYMVAGVFTNRLRQGMLLQTDPTVIYGLGSQYTGRLTRKNLNTDTPYNTYTRTGLTPTPIAMPGRDALLAALNPAKTSALYFVSRGDGTSHFSDSLNDHNRAVDHYIRGRPALPRPSSTVIEE